MRDEIDTQRGGQKRPDEGGEAVHVGVVQIRIENGAAQDRTRREEHIVCRDNFAGAVLRESLVQIDHLWERRPQRIVASTLLLRDTSP